MQLITQINPNTIFLLLIAIFNAITALMTWRTHYLAETIKKATDGLSSALVISTAKASFSEGKEQGRVDEINRNNG